MIRSLLKWFAKLQSHRIGDLKSGSWQAEATVSRPLLLVNDRNGRRLRPRRGSNRLQIPMQINNQQSLILPEVPKRPGVINCASYAQGVRVANVVIADISEELKHEDRFVWV